MLQSMMMPLSEFDHAEKGDALHCKFALVTYLGVNRDNSNSILYGILPSIAFLDQFVWSFNCLLHEPV